MDRGLLQRGAASELGIDAGTLWNWENDRAEPATRNWPSIIRFLGFNPLEPGITLPERIRTFRRLSGASQERLASLLEVDETTVWAWEKGRRAPAVRHRVRLDALLSRDVSATPEA
jgi:DNA-binding XRE family transcriptional regulator